MYKLIVRLRNFAVGCALASLCLPNANLSQPCASSEWHLNNDRLLLTRSPRSAAAAYTVADAERVGLRTQTNLKAQDH